MVYSEIIVQCQNRVHNAVFTGLLHGHLEYSIVSKIGRVGAVNSNLLLIHAPKSGWRMRNSPLSSPIMNRGASFLSEKLY